MMAGILPIVSPDAMTDTQTESVASTPPAAPVAEPSVAQKKSQDRRARSRQGARAARRPDAAPPAASRPPRSHPVLEQLAALYPHLFGAVFLPLKRGIYQDLLAAHPEALQPDALKEALALHTRSTRYLTGVAAGQQRHDLQGRAVEPMAPEHVHHALLEVFRRRQGRANEDLRPKLRERMVQAFEASGLTREAYVELVRSRDETANTLLDEALAEAAARAAKEEALLRAFDASGQAVETFASMYGLDPRSAARTLERARQRRVALAS
jgi:ProP effector